MENISNLVVEVTRRCNMSCDHCLRGCGQNMDLQDKHIETLTSQLENGYISNITFSGGEPSLNVKAIESFQVILN